MKQRSSKRKNRFEIRFVTDPDDPDRWLTLDQIREKLPPGNWRHNKVLELVDAAMSNGTVPSAFLDLTTDDKALIIAYNRATRTMRAYDDYLASEAAKK